MQVFRNDIKAQVCDATGKHRSTKAGLQKYLPYRIVQFCFTPVIPGHA